MRSNKYGRFVMFRLRAGISFVAVLLLLTATEANADPITFSLQNGVFASGAMISGTVTIDTATGSFVSADLIYSELGGSNLTFDQSFFSQATEEVLRNGNFVPVTFGAVADGPGNPFGSPPEVDELDLFIPGGLLIGYTGGTLCSDSIFCGGGAGSTLNLRVGITANDDLVTGDLAPVPEPSGYTLTLFGGAVLCGFVVLERFRRVQVLVGRPSPKSFT
jgi:hypothetical protein